MRLSDIKGDRTLDVIAELIEPVTSIAQDKEAAALFTRQACPDGIQPRDFMLDRVKKSLPLLMKQHKEDLISILATLEGRPTDEYRESMNLASVMGGLYELITDEEFLAFFS
jgi:hypothetical protein